MANKIVLKKSSVSSKVPLAGDLEYGELALNYTDEKLYFKNAANAIKSFNVAQSTLTIGTGLSGTSYNGTSAVTIAINSTVATLTGTQTLTNKTIAASNNTISGLTNSNLSGTAGISNANLANSSVTIGSTAIALGASATTIAGLTSVTSTGFTGALTGNASTATTLQNARTIGGVSFNGSANIDLPGVNTAGNQNTTGTSAGVVRTVAGTTSAELVRGNMADNDQFRILVGATASNAGYVEIATADDGTEPIYVRQYTGVFTTLTRTATLLDASGNTSFPGTVTAPTFSGALSGNASTATTLQTTRTINGVNFNGSANITVTANTTNALTIGTGLSGTSFNGSGAVTIAIDSTVATLTGTQTLTNKTLSSPTLTGSLTAGGSTGTNGQFLQSTGSGAQWVTISIPTSNHTLNAEFAASSITTETTVYSFAIATYRTAKYIIQLTNGTAYNSLEVLVSHNGTNVWIATNSSSYATNDPAAGSYFDGNYINLALREGDIQIGTINAGIRFYISGGNLIFAAVANTGTVSVKGQVTLIKV
jgi:hypothetical protein